MCLLNPGVPFFLGERNIWTLKLLSPVTFKALDRVSYGTWKGARWTVPGWGSAPWVSTLAIGRNLNWAEPGTVLVAESPASRWEARSCLLLAHQLQQTLPASPLGHQDSNQGGGAWAPICGTHGHTQGREPGGGTCSLRWGLRELGFGILSLAGYDPWAQLSRL